STNVPIALDITPPLATCSTNITVTATGNCPAVVTFTISGKDDCFLASVTANPPSGSAFPVGTNVVTVTASDSAHNTNTCIFTVTVLAGTPPKLTVAHSTTNAVLSWPASYTCYNLQYTPKLILPVSSNVWTLYSGPRTTNG